MRKLAENAVEQIKAKARKLGFLDSGISEALFLVEEKDR